jgi:septum formation protein
MWQQQSEFILASSSPRRIELLSQQGLKFTSVSPNVDETVLPNEAPDAYVQRLAIAKAEIIAQSVPGVWVIGSDTTIGFAKQILGKPRDEAHCVAMLTSLSDSSHQVYTATALVCCHSVPQDTDKHIERHVVLNTSIVTLTQITEAQARAYWRTGEPADKAGSYAIQGIGGAFVASCEGSYSAIVGLPLVESIALLRKVGVIDEC